MIAYVTLGTNDMERATSFYNALLAELDPAIKVIMDAGRIKLWGKPGAPNLAVSSPFDGGRGQFRKSGRHPQKSAGIGRYRRRGTRSAWRR